MGESEFLRLSAVFKHIVSWEVFCYGIVVMNEISVTAIDSGYLCPTSISDTT